MSEMDTRLNARQFPGRGVPFFERHEPEEIPQILASEVGYQKIGAILRASQTKRIVPGQVLGHIAASDLYVAVKSGLVKDAIADTENETEIVLSGNPGFEVGDEVSVGLTAGATTKTLTGVAYDAEEDETTLTMTAIGVGALAVGARVKAADNAGGKGIAIAGQYAEGSVAFKQQMEVFVAGSFKKASLVDYDANILSDLSGREKTGRLSPEYLGGANVSIVSFF